MCPSSWKPVVNTWAEKAILPVDPRYKTVIHVDKPDAHVSPSVEACGGHLGRHAHSALGYQVQNGILCTVDEPGAHASPVMDTWADTPILPVDPRARTVFHVDEPGAHVSLPVEAYGAWTPGQARLFCP